MGGNGEVEPRTLCMLSIHSTPPIQDGISNYSNLSMRLLNDLMVIPFLKLFKLYLKQENILQMRNIFVAIKSPNFFLNPPIFKSSC